MLPRACRASVSEICRQRRKTEWHEQDENGRGRKEYVFNKRWWCLASSNGVPSRGTSTPKSAGRQSKGRGPGLMYRGPNTVTC